MADETNVQTPTESTEEATPTVLGDTQQTETQGTEQQTEQKTETADGPPEKYEFKVEGVEIDTAMVETYSPVFKELGLKQEQAQKLVDLYAKQIQQQGEQQKAQIDQFYEQLRADAMKIPAEEIGMAKSALNKFPEEGKALMSDAYIGNHPAVIKFLAKYGKLIAEDGMHEGNQGRGERDEKAILNTLYPSMKTDR